MRLGIKWLLSPSNRRARDFPWVPQSINLPLIPIQFLHIFLGLGDNRILARLQSTIVKITDNKDKAQHHLASNDTWSEDFLIKIMHLTFSYVTSFDFRENCKTCDKCLNVLILVALHSRIWESPLWNCFHLWLSTQLENTGKHLKSVNLQFLSNISIAFQINTFVNSK